MSATVIQQNNKPADPIPLGTMPAMFMVDVTADDIDFGIRDSGNWCPIARAVRRVLQSLGAPVWDLDVDVLQADIAGGADEGYIGYWHNAAAFVTGFDRGECVTPRQVTLQRLEP